MEGLNTTHRSIQGLKKSFALLGSGNTKKEATQGSKPAGDVELLISSRDVEDVNDLLQLMSVNSANTRVFLAFGESYRMDKTSGSYIYKKLSDSSGHALEEREYVELRKFEEVIEGTQFFRVRVINGSKETLEKECPRLLNTPFMIKERRLIAQVIIAVHRTLFGEQEALCEITLNFDTDIDPMMTVTETDNVIARLKTLKEQLSRLCLNEKWYDLFGMASGVEISATLPFKARYSDSSFQLQREEILAGIIACSRKSQGEIEALLTVYKAFPDRVNSPNIKNLLINPTNITAQLIVDKHPWSDHILQPKIDGERILVIIQGKVVTLIGETHFSSFTTEQPEDSAIIECERVENILFALDIYMHQDHVTRELRYLERLLLITQVVGNISGKGFETIARLGEFSIACVDYIHVLPHTAGKVTDYLQESFSRFNEPMYKPSNIPASEFPTDGIIISENLPEPQERKFKWKPPHLMTIDLYAHQLDKNTLPQGYEEEYQDYVPIGLFTHISKSDMRNVAFEFSLQIPNPQINSPYTLVPFQPVIRKNVYLYWRLASDELEQSISGKVVELRFNTQAKSPLEQWELHRIRTDKNPQIGEFGNYFNIAEQTFFDIINPLEFEMLFNVKRINWLSKQGANKDYERLRQYEKVVREMLYKYTQYYRGKSIRSVTSTQRSAPNMNEQKTVVDINLGVSDDLLIYSQFGFKKLICVTDTISQVSELINTKYKSTNKNVPKPLLEIIYTESMSDIHKIETSIRSQPIDCVLVNIVNIPEEQPILETVLESVDRDCLVIAIQIDQTPLLHFVKTYEGSQKSKLKISIKDTTIVRRAIQREHSQKNKKNKEDTIVVSYVNPEAGVVSESVGLNTHHLSQYMKQRNFEELQSFNMDMTGNFSEFPKDYLAQLFSLKQQLTQEEIDFLAVFKVFVFVKKN